MKDPEDELTCSICLEQVNGGDLVRSLPCLHQVHPLPSVLICGLLSLAVHNAISKIH